MKLGCVSLPNRISCCSTCIYVPRLRPSKPSINCWHVHLNRRHRRTVMPCTRMPGRLCVLWVRDFTKSLLRLGESQCYVRSFNKVCHPCAGLGVNTNCIVRKHLTEISRPGVSEVNQLGPPIESIKQKKKADYQNSALDKAGHPRSIVSLCVYNRIKTSAEYSADPEMQDMTYSCSSKNAKVKWLKHFALDL